MTTAHRSSAQGTRRAGRLPSSMSITAQGAMVTMPTKQRVRHQTPIQNAVYGGKVIAAAPIHNKGAVLGNKLIAAAPGHDSGKLTAAVVIQSCAGRYGDNAHRARMSK